MKKQLNRMIVIILAACMAVMMSVPGFGEENGAVSALSIADNIVRVHLSSYGSPASAAIDAAGSHTI
ncbi:MAG: hypothetical protein LBS85_07930, partial [Clostridiales Family XIII bacterium]|nr:hypothetical protein [Clostridiales Family XIII bacterium]